ncbi:putative holin-like toxin [Bacillus piscicola]|uniref:putative holin-like toxin n=1 Tax=Bacillus piscicola TaxID=1632684 RepID=UPI001F094195|nr:putative holin-like toxin [Bacillus piscicola]
MVTLRRTGRTSTAVPTGRSGFRRCTLNTMISFGILIITIVAVIVTILQNK